MAPLGEADGLFISGWTPGPVLVHVGCCDSAIQGSASQGDSAVMCCE